MRSPLDLASLLKIPPREATKFVASYRAAVFSYAKFGLPLNWYDGPIEYINRHNGDTANGSFKSNKNVVTIFYPQINSAVDLTWSIVHEMAHRLWKKGLTNKLRKDWLSTYSSIHSKLSPEAVRTALVSARLNKRTPLWFFFKRYNGADIPSYSHYLSNIVYAPSELPRNYSSASPEEAWADTIASIVLGRSHNANLMRKSGSLVRKAAIDILKIATSGGFKFEEAAEIMEFKRSKLSLHENRGYNRSPLVSLVEVETQDAPEPSGAVDSDEVDTLILPLSKTTDTANEFNDQVKKAIVSVSDDMRNILKSKGFSIVTCHLLGDALPPSENEQGPVTPWNIVSSAYLPSDKQIIISEVTNDSNGGEVSNLNTEGLLRHTIGHAIDSLAPELMSDHFHDKLSDLESFKYAHTSDIGRLGNDKKAKLAYFVEDGDISRSECFAECFAALHGGGSIYSIEVMNKYFSATMKQIRDIVQSVESGQQISDVDQGDEQDQKDK